MQDVVHVADGLLGQRPAIAASFAEQRPVEAVEVGGGKLLQLDPAERRDDVRGDVDPVVRHGAGPAALRRHGREPLVGEEAGDRAPRRFNEGALAEIGEGVVQGVLAVLLGAEAALAALSRLAREGIRHPEVPGPGFAALADAAPHGSSSASIPSMARSRAVGT
jgi:hypothetical protein